MSIETSRIMFVDAKSIHKYPTAFQEYVERFFRKETIFGSEYYFAFLLLSISQENNKRKGIAPCHSCDVDYFGKNASEPCEDLYNVIKNLLKDEKSGVYEISQSFDDGRGWGHVD